MAEDLDSLVNGEIVFSIVSGDRENQFFIDPITGLMKVNKRLDREMVRTAPFCCFIFPVCAHNGDIF